MGKDLIGYSALVENGLRSVVREALRRVAAEGWPGTHHAYIAFNTAAPGVELPDSLLARYPDELTIVLQHQYWDLEVEDDHFAVTLSFNKVGQRVVVPFAALTSYADPSVKFGLQFGVAPEVGGEVAPKARGERVAPEVGGERVAPEVGGEVAPEARGERVPLEVRGEKAPSAVGGDKVPPEADGAEAGEEESAPETGGEKVVALDLFRKK